MKSLEFFHQKDYKKALELIEREIFALDEIDDENCELYVRIICEIINSSQYSIQTVLSVCEKLQSLKKHKDALIIFNKIDSKKFKSTSKYYDLKFSLEKNTCDLELISKTAKSYFKFLELHKRYFTLKALAEADNQILLHYPSSKLFWFVSKVKLGEMKIDELYETLLQENLLASRELLEILERNLSLEHDIVKTYSLLFDLVHLKKLNKKCKKGLVNLAIEWMVRFPNSGLGYLVTYFLSERLHNTSLKEISLEELHAKYGVVRTKVIIGDIEELTSRRIKRNTNYEFKVDKKKINNSQDELETNFNLSFLVPLYSDWITELDIKAHKGFVIDETSFRTITDIIIGFIEMGLLRSAEFYLSILKKRSNKYTDEQATLVDYLQAEILIRANRISEAILFIETSLTFIPFKTNQELSFLVLLKRCYLREKEEKKALSIEKMIREKERSC